MKKKAFCLIVSCIMAIAFVGCNQSQVSDENASGTMVNTLVGKIGMVMVDIPSRGVGEVEIDGENYNAVSDRDAIPKGTYVRVIDEQGDNLVVKIEPDVDTF